MPLARRAFFRAATASLASLLAVACDREVGSGSAQRPPTGSGPRGDAANSPSAQATRSEGRQYATDFSLTENPISEGGHWHRNQSNAWTNVRTWRGHAYGTNGARNTYDDSYAYLSGFPADVEAEAVIHRQPFLVSRVTHEVELLFRVMDSESSVRCYEALFAHHGGVQIMRWNGSLGDFTELGSAKLGRNLRSGDVIKARIAGPSISCYVNGALLAQASDARWKDGHPGIGFFTRPGGNSAHFALSSYVLRAL
jgi:hypothetical protein